MLNHVNKIAMEIGIGFKISFLELLKMCGQATTGRAACVGI